MRVEGPVGVHATSEMFRKLLPIVGMALVFTSEKNVAVLFGHLLEIHPSLKQSDVKEPGYFMLQWNGGEDALAWCCIAGDEATSGALFVPVKSDGGGIPRLFVELQNAAATSGLRHDGVFMGEASPECAEFIDRSTVIPASVLLGQS